LYSNNLYNRMTHEAIKNFDWTYSRDYVSGEEQDNIEGGLRMQQILYFIGRVFDDIKNKIETIKIVVILHITD
ncbi:MAG: TIP41 family protein, partial [Bacilli bacterium]|nr:TIP41 family protein [Bacilli bacterium]